MLAAIALELGDYAVIGGMILMCLSLPMTLMIYNLRVLSRRIELVEERIEKVGTTRVGHEQWLRIVASQQNRLNAMATQLSELGGKLDASFSIGTGLNRVASAIEKQQEHSHV